MDLQYSNRCKKPKKNVVVIYNVIMFMIITGLVVYM